MFPTDVIFEEVEQDIEDDNFLDNNYTSLMFDFEEGEFVLMDGNPVIVTGRESVQVWLYKNIKTKLNRYIIYEDKGRADREYGSDMLELISGKKLPRILSEAEAERDISEMCVEHPFIRNIQNFTIRTEGIRAYVSFHVILKDGDMIDVREEVYIV